MKILYLFMIFGAFLAGAFIAVLDPITINWPWMSAVLFVGVIGLWGYRRALHHSASSGHRLADDMLILSTSMSNIAENLARLNAGKAGLPVYDARFEIDRLFREDLDNFANARETMIHVFGMKDYAEVMSAFAAGERYINRVWSASTDGYEDEVNRYLQRASDQFSEAESLFRQLQADAQPAAAVSI